MLIPLGALALGAIFAGMIWLKPFFGDHDKMVKFFGMPHHVEMSVEGHGDDHAADAHGAAAHGDDHAMADKDHGAERGAIYMSAESEAILDEAHHAPKWVKISPFLAMLIGLVTAWVMYIRKPEWPAKLAENQRPLYLFLLNKWYFDELYDFVFVRPAQALGRFLWKRGDENTIDGGINGLAMGIVPFLTRLAGRAQSGYVFTYAFAMVLGIAAILTWVTLTGGAH
jgi:NADH-quinone oxidoreductase subunit L